MALVILQRSVAIRVEMQKETVLLGESYFVIFLSEDKTNVAIANVL